MRNKRIKTIWKFGKKYVLMFAISEMCILLLYAISIILPMILSRLVDEVLNGFNRFALSEIIRDYCILLLIGSITNIVYAFVWQYLTNNYVLSIKKKMFEKIIFACPDYLSNIKTGDLMTRIEDDSKQFIHVVQRNLFHFVNSIIMCAGIVFIVARINIYIAMILLVAAILPIVFTRFFGKFTEKYSIKLRENVGAVASRIYEFIKGLRELKIFGTTNQFGNKIFNYFEKNITLGNKTRINQFWVEKGTYFVNLTTSLIIYAFSAALIFRGEMTTGAFLAIIEYVSLLHKKFNWLLRILLDWFNRRVSIDRVNEVLEIESENSDGHKIENIYKIQVKNVSFEYEKGLSILNDVSLDINAGEQIGIVGRSGCGKTTFISLLLGFYKISKGDIYINGISISQIDLINLRKKIAVVSQEITIFEDTIRYNLNLAENYSDEEIYEALKHVNLDELIMNLPNGLDTVISRTSHNLSGGQKQRLMIARMLLKKPKFVILDEATSALDIVTEKKILDLIFSYLGNATMIIISHRLELVKKCNKIIVLDNNHIKAEGAHQELLLKSPTYKSLFGRENSEK